MLKVDPATACKFVFIWLMTSFCIPEARSQYYANATLAKLNDSGSLHTVSLQQSEKEQVISLKEALQSLKRRYHLRFAYRAGLLDGKVIHASLLEEQLTPEAMVSKILSHCELQFKQINKRQYSIFSTDSQRPRVSNQSTTATASEIITSDETQNLVITVSGTVTAADDGQPLPGVNVLLKGTATGTATDSDGKYIINLPDDGGTLIFSFVGFATQEIVYSNQTIIDVVMPLESKTLGEVVVTALGIEKDKKALAYSVTEVKGEEFTQARELNIANALTGKVAGVNATGLSTGPGGSSRVIIRGNGSFNGDNQPLYVVNGMPIDNTSIGGSPIVNGGGLNVDRGDGISGINPDDIESISVLKGGTAAALYGSRASNGVILITTKKGKEQKGVGVELNSSFTAETIAVYPSTFQYQYGHGRGNLRPSNQAEAILWGRLSWGQKIDGQNYISIDGKEHPYAAVHVKDNLNDFYRIGNTFTNTVALTGGTDKLNFRLSVSNTDNAGILRHSSLNKKIANLTINSKLNEKITIEGLVQFNVEKVRNRSGAGDAYGNPNWIYMLANTVDDSQLAPGDLPNGNEFVWNQTPVATNPYFVVNKFKTSDEKNRFIGQASVKYDILDNLFVKGTVSRDFYNFNFVGIIPTGTQYLNPPGSGEYHALKVITSETNSLLMINYSKTLLQHFNINAMVGGNRRSYEGDETAIDGTQFVIPFFYSYTNLATLTTKPYRPRTKTNSIFGSLDFDYKGMAFLTVTGRQDWFSTLNAENNTIFYPSVGGSFVLSEAFDLPAVVSFAKLRGSWAQVGGATPTPYAVNLTYSMVQGGHNGRPLQQVTSSTITDPALKPLTSTTFEVGFDARFLQNRLGIDFAYYDRKTTNDIVEASVSLASGYRNARMNVGELQNRGIELLITATPVKTQNFSWDVSYNVAHNASKVVRLADGLPIYQVASSVNNYAGIYHEVGRPYGIIKGNMALKDANGNQVFNAAGTEQKTPLPMELGPGVPPLTMGITNTFNYKRFTLSVLIDGKFGNKVYSIMDTYAHRFGLLERTLVGRDEGGLTVNGVDLEGNPYSQFIDYNTNAFSNYYDNHKNFAEMFTYDGSFIKLRQTILTYNIPVGKLKLIKLQGASISFVGRNLAILYKKTPNFDPESSHTNGNAQGIESFSLPRTRSYGVNLMIKF
jgi:TonB-linked SusC/RagA family outer membrane protein